MNAALTDSLPCLLTALIKYVPLIAGSTIDVAGCIVEDDMIALPPHIELVDSTGCAE